ncbi:hypothetical protein BC936DRAFT_148384 [Jimgerdemannia flammicorona]|uniref:Uncharacterized protein n=1 Tax=Jimgerdemannia flammicorona TaxID=994334 RepID=A0A433DKL8_9FUNG|nr:hypothetical protein BC936DRAFT_148384 [Jimgerdemannia flammicorona]
MYQFMMHTQVRGEPLPNCQAPCLCSGGNARKIIRAVPIFMTHPNREKYPFREKPHAHNLRQYWVMNAHHRHLTSLGRTSPTREKGNSDHFVPGHEVSSIAW